MEERSRYPLSDTDHALEPVQMSKVLRPNPDEQAFHHHLTLGIEETLQAHPLIRDIKMAIRQPVLPSNLLSWERKYRRKLPTDLKNYYYSTNGFRLTWSLEYGTELLRVGEMSINSLSQFIPLASEGGSGNDDSIAGHSKLFPKYSNSIGTDNGDSMVKNVKNKRHDVSESSGPRMSFAELRKLENECSHGHRDTSKDGKRSSSILLPPEGEAFQLDSSKPDKGIVCLVYLTSASRLRIRQHRHQHQSTTKKGDNTTEFHQLPKEDNFRERRKAFQNTQPFSTESVNKSLDELQEEQDVASKQSEFLSDDDFGYAQIWFLDSSFGWHFMAPTFSHYYRMLLYHFGLPEWEYRFTPFGVSAYAEQMFWIVAPHLLQPVKSKHNACETKKPDSDNMIKHKDSIIWSNDYPPEAGKPNPVNNVINMNLFRKKKKDRNVTDN